MRVLHVLNTSSYSGAENVACQIIHMFEDEENMDMAYCSPNGTIKESLKERNINYYPVTKLSISELKRVIKEYKPTLIHAHDMKAGFMCALSCDNIPLISHIHNNNYDSRKLSLKSVLYFLAAKKAKHIFWVSQSSFDGYYFHKYFKNKSSVLYNVISTEQLFDKAQKDTNDYNYDIIYLGRMTYQKHPERLIGVLEKIIRKDNKVRCALIGTGELGDKVRSLLAEKNLNSNIDFLGFNSNPYKILACSKVMIMTSRWEGTPMCALEAMALGIPIVSTPTDGLCELIDDGKTGYISDDNEVLTDKCLSIVHDEHLQKQLSDNTIKKASKILDVTNYKRALVNGYNQKG